MCEMKVPGEHFLTVRPCVLFFQQSLAEHLVEGPAREQLISVRKFEIGSAFASFLLSAFTETKTKTRAPQRSLLGAHRAVDTER